MLNNNSFAFFVLSLVIFFYGCKKSVVPPSITTLNVSNVFANQVQSGGIISSEGSSKVTSRGVVWSTTQNPSILLSTKTTDSSGIGTYTSKITGLAANTKYYIRAYATNASGTYYGNEVSFNTNDIDISSGLMAYYPFSGNAGDSSGNNNHGVMYSITLTTDRFGITKSAFNFNGNNSYVGVKDSETLRPRKITISAWYYTKINDAYQCLVSKADKQYLFDLTTSSLLIKDNCTSNGSSLLFSPPLNSMVTINKWVHILTSWDGSNLKIYKDGIEMKGGYFPNNQIITGNIDNCLIGDFKIGAWTNNSPRWFNGEIDDVRVYNRPLTQSEITYLATH